MIRIGKRVPWIVIACSEAGTVSETITGSGSAGAAASSRISTAGGRPQALRQWIAPANVFGSTVSTSAEVPSPGPKTAAPLA